MGPIKYVDQELDKLEHWISFAWMVWPLKGNGVVDVKPATLSLFRQRPSSIQRIRQLMERRKVALDVPELFQQICEQVDRETSAQAGQ